MRISTRQGLAVAVLALGVPATFASSASAAACDPATYPVPFLRFYGGTYNTNTRFIELHVRPNRKQDSNVNAWADVAYPFTVTLSPSNGASRNFTVTNYARQQFPAKFTSKTQTTHVTATYDEIHTSYPGLPGVPVTTTCSRTISNTYKAPPKPKPPKKGGSTGGGGTNGHRDDPED